MKRFFNVLAFIIIVGLTGSWECGCISFRTYLYGTGSVLTVLLAMHIVRIGFFAVRTKRRRIA